MTASEGEDPWRNCDESTRDDERQRPANATKGRGHRRAVDAKRLKSAGDAVPEMKSHHDRADRVEDHIRGPAEDLDHEPIEVPRACIAAGSPQVQDEEPEHHQSVWRGCGRLARRLAERRHSRPMTRWRHGITKRRVQALGAWRLSTAARPPPGGPVRRVRRPQSRAQASRGRPDGLRRRLGARRDGRAIGSRSGSRPRL
jgi:hypothetical protein